MIARKIIAKWNAEADEYNQWDTLSEDEKGTIFYGIGALRMQQAALKECNKAANTGIDFAGAVKCMGAILLLPIPED